MSKTTTPATLARCPGGFVVAQPLPDGRILVESWRLNPAPFGGGDPVSEVFHHWIAADVAEAQTTVTEFVDEVTSLRDGDFC